jgi:hypothetical protein
MAAIYQEGLVYSRMAGMYIGSIQHIVLFPALGSERQLANSIVSGKILQYPVAMKVGKIQQGKYCKYPLAEQAGIQRELSSRRASGYPVGSNQQQSKWVSSGK